MLLVDVQEGRIITDDEVNPSSPPGPSSMLLVDLQEGRLITGDEVNPPPPSPLARGSEPQQN